MVDSPKVQLFCAVTDSLAEGLNCLLSREVWELLMKYNPNLEIHNPAEISSPSGGDRDVSNRTSSEPAAAVWEIAGEAAADGAVGADEAAEVESPRIKLLASQLADDGLKKAWSDAMRGKAGMFVSNGYCFIGTP